MSFLQFEQDMPWDWWYFMQYQFIYRILYWILGSKSERHIGHEPTGWSFCCCVTQTFRHFVWKQLWQLVQSIIGVWFYIFVSQFIPDHSKLSILYLLQMQATLSTISLLIILLILLLIYPFYFIFIEPRSILI